MVHQYHFYKTKYNQELLIDLIRLETLEKYLQEHPIHTLTYYDITLITEGQGLFSLDGITQPIEKGSVFFSSPGQIRCWDFHKMPQGYALIFEEDFMGEFFNDALFVRNLAYFNRNGESTSLTLSMGEYDQLVQMMQAILSEIDRFPVKDQHVLRALLYYATMFYNRLYLQQHQLSGTEQFNRYILQFRKLVDNHFREIRTVEYYAEQLHVSPGYLNELIRKHIGCSAKQFILNRTMLEAKRLVGYTDQAISEIATALNFESSTYFNRTFLKHTRQTPLNYRRKLHEK